MTRNQRRLCEVLCSPKSKIVKRIAKKLGIPIKKLKMAKTKPELLKGLTGKGA